MMTLTILFTHAIQLKLITLIIPHSPSMHVSPKQL